MKKISSKRIAEETKSVTAYIAVMFLFLLCGMITGYIFSLYAGKAESNYLFQSELKNIITYGIGDYSFGQAFFNLLKYPAAIFILSYTAFGIFAIPATVAMKGFFMSVSVAYVIQTIGRSGIFLALAILGIQALASIPCILITAAFSFEISSFFFNASRKAKQHFYLTQRKPDAAFVIVFVMLCLIFALVAMLDIALTPTLVSLASKYTF